MICTWWHFCCNVFIFTVQNCFIIFTKGVVNASIWNYRYMCMLVYIWVQLPFSSGQDGEDWSKSWPLIARRTCMEPAPILGFWSLGLDGTNSRFLHFSYKTRGAYSYLYTNTILACKYSFSYKMSHFDNITSCTDFQVY